MTVNEVRRLFAWWIHTPPINELAADIARSFKMLPRRQRRDHTGQVAQPVRHPVFRIPGTRPPDGTTEPAVAPAAAVVGGYGPVYSREETIAQLRGALDG